MNVNWLGNNIVDLGPVPPGVIEHPGLVQMAPSLYRLRMPGEVAHLLNSYIWMGRDGVTLVDTGWPHCAPVIKRALAALGTTPAKVVRVVLTHFHEDHAGSAAEIAAWSSVEITAGVADAPFITGARRGPLPALTARERAIHPGSQDPPSGPPCRVDRAVDDGDVLDFAGGASAISVPGHTPGSIALYLPAADALLTGDAVAEVNGEVILGVFNTDRREAYRSLEKLAATDAGVAGFGHGEAVLDGASDRIRHAVDPFGP